ncbi:MAG: bestrophin family protein [Fimbriiglobus sp.]
MGFWRRGIFLTLWPPLPVWRRLDVAVLAVGLYTVAVGEAVHYAQWNLPNIGAFSAALNTLVLGVLLQFRNRESYDRWWEGRKLWGQLVNDSRNLCIKVRHLSNIPNDDRAGVGRAVAGFAVGLKNHLRGVGILQDVPGFATSAACPNHVPSHVATEIVAMVQSWRRSGKITEVDVLILDPHLRAFMDICGACERIRSTPIPQSYRSLLRHGLVLYLLSTPWLIVESLLLAACPVMALTAYFLIGIELTAEDVEEPFGRDGDDLDLTKYCETIRKSAAELLGVGLMSAPSSLSLVPAGPFGANVGAGK